MSDFFTKEGKIPKVLIIGNTFEPSGGSVTLKNLFSQFPKENLTCACARRIGVENFDEFYLLGKSEIKYASPFSIFEKAHRSIVLKGIDKEKKQQKKSGYKQKIYQKIVYPWLYFTKLYHYRLKYVVSKELTDWIRENEPDIIYSALGNLNMNLFLLQLHRGFPHIKLAIHVLDDWLNTQANKVLFSRSYQKQLKSSFKSLIDAASIRIAISDKMAQSYANDYGYDFQVFHNPVHCEKYINAEKKRKDCETAPKVIAYLGKINWDTCDVINDVIKAVDNLNARGERVLFKIHTTTNEIFVKSHIAASVNVQVSTGIPHEDVPIELANSNVLLLPLSFDEKSKAYTRLSIPTKMTEYMASGTPILVYAPNDIALVEYANSHRIALCISERNIEQIEHGLMSLLDNKSSSTIEMSERAQCLAKEKHGILDVSRNFLKLFMNNVSINNSVKK